MTDADIEAQIRERISAAMADRRTLLRLLDEARAYLRRVGAGFDHALLSLRIVGDDYPGSSCQRWCHEAAEQAEQIAHGNVSDPEKDALRERAVQAERERDTWRQQAGIGISAQFKEGAQYEQALAGLRADNARLVEALQPLASIPVEEFGKQGKPDYPLMGWNNHRLYVRDVLRARAAIAGEKHG